MQYVKFNRLLTKGGGGVVTAVYFLFNGDGNISMPAAVLDNTKPNRVEYLLDRTDITTANNDIWGSDDTSCYGRLREFDFRSFRAGAGANIVELTYARNVLYQVVETIVVAGVINVTMTPLDGGPILSGNVNVGLSTISVGLSIGNRIGGNGLNGRVSDFKIFDDTNTLIHHWPINEGTGTVINDIVGGADGTLTAGTGYWVGGAAINPGDLINLDRWYKADGTLYTDAAGTDLVDTNLDPIGYATDESGTGFPAINSNTATKPYWESAKPEIQFVSGDILLDNSDFIIDDFTFGIAFKVGLSNAEYLFSVEHSAAITNQLWFRIGVGANTRLLYTAGGSQSVIDYPTLNFSVSDEVILFVQKVLGETRVYQYTADTLTEHGTRSAVGDFTTSLNLGLRLGSADSTTTNFDGSIYEFFKTTDGISESSMAAQGASFAAKWGIP